MHSSLLDTKEEVNLEVTSPEVHYHFQLLVCMFSYFKIFYIQFLNIKNKTLDHQ
jgi:hypothetical protein